jgi:hypothetical protein
MVSTWINHLKTKENTKFLCINMLPWDQNTNWTNCINPEQPSHGVAKRNHTILNCISWLQRPHTKIGTRGGCNAFYAGVDRWNSVRTSIKYTSKRRRGGTPRQSLIITLQWFIEVMMVDWLILLVPWGTWLFACRAVVCCMEFCFCLSGGSELILAGWEVFW